MFFCNYSAPCIDFNFCYFLKGFFTIEKKTSVEPTMLMVHFNTLQN